MRSCVRLLVLVVAALMGFGHTARTEESWEFLSTTTIKAHEFLTAHPEWDGRGVLIAVLDSGVELGLPGLRTTPDGQPKILDAREFSDEGQIELGPALHDSDTNGAAVFTKGGRWLYGIDEIEPQPAADGEILIGYFEESKYHDSGVDDLNNNGRSDEIFGVVAYKAPGSEDDAPWIAFVDTNADGRLSDEQPIHDYFVKRESFHLRGHDLHDSADLVTCALNLWPDEKRAALYLEGQGHGTHVTGIAAGFGISGQKGYDGIAPGAQILALKIGNDSLSGGATTPGSMINAWRHAVDVATRLEMPLVIQMSYGIGSEFEGAGVAEQLIDELLRENPSVAATVSAGNSGPGVSTVGMPAGADEVLAVAAVLARSTANAIYGIDLPEDRMFAFSSRGGELAKPDIAGPGFAASAIPDWRGTRPVMRGTSMAAPQAAGACALLYSAARGSGLPIRRDLVRAALTRGAHRLPGLGPLDQGAGLIDVVHAFDVYRHLAARDRHDPVSYDIRVPSPALPDGVGRTFFDRGGFLVNSPRPHEVTFSPVFRDEPPESFVRRFYRAFDLSSDAGWVQPGKDSTYLKQDAEAGFPLLFDTSRMTAPGLYQARILGWDKTLGKKDRQRLGPELVIPVAVAVPVPFENHLISGASRELQPSTIDRVFFRTRPWTGSITAEVEIPDDQRAARVSVSLFDPEGRETYLGILDAARPRLTHVVDDEHLEPGVWELALWARLDNRFPVQPRFRLTELPLASPIDSSIKIVHKAGSTPHGSIDVTAALDSLWTGTGSASVTGHVSRVGGEVEGHLWKHELRFDPEETSLELRFEMSAEDWTKFTDVALRIVDGDGHAVVQSGFNARRLEVNFDRPSQGSPEDVFVCEVLAATADPDAKNSSWKLEVDEIRKYHTPIAVSLHQQSQAELVFLPDLPAQLDLSFEHTPPALPDGAAWRVEVTLVPHDERDPNLKFTTEAR